MSNRINPGRKKMIPKNPNASDMDLEMDSNKLKYNPLPHVNVAIKRHRVTEDRIADMEKKLDNFMFELKTPHPLIDMLEKKKRKQGIRIKSTTLTKEEDKLSYSVDEVSSGFSLKSDLTESHDIHKARKVQKLMENRRRYFDGELNTTFDKVGYQKIKGSDSSDEDAKSIDSRKATFGSSGISASGFSEDVEDEVSNALTLSIGILHQSSGYSEDDELSVGDSDDQLDSDLSVSEQTSQSSFNDGNGIDRPLIANFKEVIKDSTVMNAFNKSKNLRKPESRNKSLPVNYEPEPRVHRRKIKIISRNFKNQLKKKSQKIKEQNGAVKARDPILTTEAGTPNRLQVHNAPAQSNSRLKRPKYKTGWNAYKSAKCPDIYYHVQTTDVESSSDELALLIKNLEGLNVTEPVNESTFSMTSVIKSTREVERKNDVRIGLMDNSVQAQKVMNERYGAIVDISSRMAGKSDFEQDATDKTNSVTNSLISSITASTPNTSMVGSPDLESFNSKLASLNSPKLKPVYDKYELISPMRDIEKTKAYVTWKLDMSSNGTFPSVILPPINRFSLTSKIEGPDLYGKLKADTDKDINLNYDIRRSKGRPNTSQTSKSLQPQPYIAFRGQTRPVTHKTRGFVPKRIEEQNVGETPENEMDFYKPKYNKLQRKRDSALPGEPDYSMDPRFLELLEVLTPCYEPKTPIWKNMPRTAIPAQKSVAPTSLSVPDAQEEKLEPSAKPNSDSKPKRRPPPPGPRCIPFVSRSAEPLDD